MNNSLGRILLVDDEAPVLEVLSEYFSTQGYTVETASSGGDALTLARQTRPDLVLLDIRMPGMDGVEVLRQLRQLDAGLAVIMVTANEDVALARETLKIGAFDYVAKPFDFRYLDRVVAASLVQAGDLPMSAGAEAGGELPNDPWWRLAFGVFRGVRGMTPAARASTGNRLETAVLLAASNALCGRLEAAGQHLSEIELLVGIAADLGDVSTAVRSAIEAAVAAARKAPTV